MGTLFSLSKTATATALDLSELILLFFGIVLVAGLVGEYRESWKKWLKMFEMLVIIGVAGELLADGGIFLLSKRLQTISDFEVAGLNKEAAEARMTAGNANERAAKLEQSLADRHITFEQRNKMLTILRAQSGTRVAVTYITPAASDAQEYSIEIGEVFRDAKWMVVQYPWLTTLDSPVHGFAVQVRGKGSASQRKLLELTTKDALSVLDDRVSVMPSGGTDPSSGLKLDLIIFVGSK